MTTKPNLSPSQADSLLADAIARHCNAGAWLRLLPRFTALGAACGPGGPHPGDWATWLSKAKPGEHVAAQQLLRAMSRHPWRVEPVRIASRPLERLHIVVSVQGQAWHVALATVPCLHAVLVDPHPASQA